MRIWSNSTVLLLIDSIAIAFAQGYSREGSSVFASIARPSDHGWSRRCDHGRTLTRT